MHTWNYRKYLCIKSMVFYETKQFISMEAPDTKLLHVIIEEWTNRVSSQQERGVCIYQAQKMCRMCKLNMMCILVPLPCLW